MTEQDNAPHKTPEQRDPDFPTTETDRPNASTEHQAGGDARRPSDTLDRGQQPSTESVPRKSSLT